MGNFITSFIEDMDSCHEFKLKWIEFIVSYMQPYAASSIGFLLSLHPNAVDMDYKKELLRSSKFN